MCRRGGNNARIPTVRENLHGDGDGDGAGFFETFPRPPPPPPHTPSPADGPKPSSSGVSTPPGIENGRDGWNGMCRRGSDRRVKDERDCAGMIDNIRGGGGGERIRTRVIFP